MRRMLEPGKKTHRREICKALREGKTNALDHRLNPAARRRSGRTSKDHEITRKPQLFSWGFLLSVRPLFAAARALFLRGSVTGTHAAKL